MRNIAAGIGCFFLFGCAGMVDKSTVTPVETSLAVHEYNEVYSQYAERPTFVEVADRHGAGLILSVKVDTYASEPVFYFPREDVGPAIRHISQYLRWEKTASEHQDKIDKKIGEAGSRTGFTHQYSIYSSNRQNHYLVIEQCPLSCGSSSDFAYLDRPSAVELKRLLSDLESGKLAPGSPKGTYK